VLELEVGRERERGVGWGGGLGLGQGQGLELELVHGLALFLQLAKVKQSLHYWIAWEVYWLQEPVCLVFWEVQLNQRKGFAVISHT